MESQEAYRPGSWGITHLSCKSGVDIDALKNKRKTTNAQPCSQLRVFQREASNVRAVTDDWWMRLRF